MSTKSKVTEPRPIVVIQDTREQAPLNFSALPAVGVEVATLDTGDYSLKGHTREICIERKSADDLVGTMINGYVSMARRDWHLGRFNRELFRMSRYHTAWIVVECPRAAIKAHAYRSQCNPEAVLAFVRTLQVYWGVHVYWAENRLDAAAEVVAICRAYLAGVREIRHRTPPRTVRTAQAVPQLPDV